MPCLIPNKNESPFFIDLKNLESSKLFVDFLFSFEIYHFSTTLDHSFFLVFYLAML